MDFDPIELVEKEYNEKLEKMERDSLISDIAVDLAIAKKFDNTLEDCVERLHQYFQADRTNFVLYNVLTGIYSIQAEFREEGILSFADLVSGKDSDVVKISEHVHEQFLKDQIVVDATVDKKDARAYYQPDKDRDDIKSMMMVPIHANNMLWGYMAFIDTKKNKEWADADIELASRIKALFTNSIEKQTVKQSSFSQARIFRIIIDHVPDAVFWKDSKLAYLGCNTAYERLYNVKEKQIVGANSYAFMPKQYAQKAEEVEQRLIDGKGGELSLRYKFTNEWGHDRWIRTTRIPIKNNYGEITAVLGLTEDITSDVIYDQQKEEHEKKLTYAVEQAEKANELKTEFLSRMSHEIRTPLSAVMALTQLALDSDDLEFVKARLQQSASASEILYNVINDLLDMSKIEADRMSIVVNKFRLEDMLSQTFDIIINTAEEKGMHLVVEMDPATPEYVIGDRNHLSQVLVNLLSNAVKFTPDDGRIRLAVRVQQDKGDSVSLMFEVEDNGVGMSPDLVDQLFDPYTQADSQTVSMQKGTGLGLAIAQKLVSLMGGNIEVSSQENVGSKFWFTLPFQKADNGKNILEKFTHRLKDVHILKIGNNSNRASTYFINYLEALGAQFKTEDNVQASIELLQDKECDTIDVVILDLAFSDASEIAALKKISEVFASDKVLILTSGVDVLTKQKAARKLGTNQTLSRPFLPSKTVHALEKVLGVEFRKARQQAAPDFGKARLLLVDDVPVNREIVTHFLKDTGIRIDEAADGEEALELFNKNPDAYDAILMDVRMPVMDGLEATSIIREAERGTSKHVPIYAITASVLGSEIRKCLDAGMDAHLVKPFQKEQLLEAIAYTIKNEKAIPANL